MKRRRSKVDWYLPLPGDGPRFSDDLPPSMVILLATQPSLGTAELTADVINLAEYRKDRQTEGTA